MPCVREMPMLNQIVEKYNSKDIVFLGITFNDKEKIQKFLKQKEFNFKIASDNKGKTIKDYKIAAYPTNIIIDQDGIITFFHRGFNKKKLKEMDHLINKLLLK